MSRQVLPDDSVGTIMAELDNWSEQESVKDQAEESMEILPDEKPEDEIKMLTLALEKEAENPASAFKQRMHRTQPLSQDQFQSLVKRRSKRGPVAEPLRDEAQCQMDEAPSGPPHSLDPVPGNERRNTPRFKFDKTVEVVWHVPGKNGETDHYFLKCQDISNGGLALIHDSEVPSNYSCTVTSFAENGKQLLWTGQVRHCTKVDEGHYMIGIKFDYAIDVNQVIAA